MTIPKYALDILVCPVCRTRIELLPDESGLKCVSCRRVYPIRDEIPVMLPEEAVIMEENQNT
ncbi:MAG TPA: Trm112 family protein [Candidatus Acidoferrum sp.]|nr:Trm112 family protein [Candidatus Acidoferrum sp.]